MDATSDKSTQNVKRRRQDPVSCSLCRLKKLKCDRQHPCSNCVSRDVACNYEAWSAARRSPDFPESNNTGLAAVSDGGFAIRLQRLEESLVNHDQRLSDLESGRSNLPLELVQKLPPMVPLKTPPVQSKELEDQAGTADYLEGIVMSHNQPRAIPSQGGLTILQAKTNPRRPGESSKTLSQIIAALPPRPEADKMVDYYVDNISHIYHFLHTPTLKRLIDGIYDCTYQGITPELSHVALLFGVLAVTAHFWPPDLSSDLMRSPQDADRVGQAYGSLTAVALVEANYMTSPTIEGIQATLLIGMLLPNSSLDSPIHKLLFFSGTLINQARNLALHRTDSRFYREERARNGSNLVDVEIRRRLWWHIVASDWLLSFMCGPQEHTYFIQPSQMAVDLPANIDDEDLPFGISTSIVNYNRPSSTATLMSYSLARIQLASISREIVDMTVENYFTGTDSGSDIAYSQILVLDRKLQDFLRDLPVFFKQDATSRRQCAKLVKERPSIAWQRSMVNLGTHTRLCRLHRGYFIRGATDPTYAYSHVVCMRAARTVLETKRIMDEEEPCFAPSSSRLWTVVHHVFLAAVVLMMDVCFNKDDTLMERRKGEVLEACRMLDRAQQESPVAKEGISATLEILQKYWPNDWTRSGPARPPAMAADREVGYTIEDMVPETDTSVGDRESGNTLKRKRQQDDQHNAPSTEPVRESEGLEQLFSDFLDSDMGFEQDIWDGLFFDLDSAAAAGV